VLLERLTPEQRAVFLLRDVFDYDYETIAEVVGKSEAACRQLAVRARRRVEQDRPRFAASRQEQDDLARMFIAAAHTGDLAGLEALLSHDVALHGDGGGKVRALGQPVFGRRQVARRLVAFMNTLDAVDGYSTRPVQVNGHPGALGFDGRGRVLYVLSLDIADGQIQSVRGSVNPDKLRHLGTVSDLLPAPRRSSS
jgi:RNA polymerase sigma-70 factor (ECF subfamily)